MSNHQKLEVWADGRKLVRDIYGLIASFPRSEMFGLTQQMRRAAVSIPSNIAEGHGRWTRRECIRFLHIARGSASELDTQLFLAEDLTFVSGEVAAPLREKIARIARMLNGLIRYYESEEPGARRQAPGAAS